MREESCEGERLERWKVGMGLKRLDFVMDPSRH
jgi:hypothetical protein